MEILVQGDPAMRRPAKTKTKAESRKQKAESKKRKAESRGHKRMKEET